MPMPQTISRFTARTGQKFFPYVSRLARQIHTVEQPQQIAGCKRDVVLAAQPVMQSALSDVQILRTSSQVHAQGLVHRLEPPSKLHAEIRVMAAQVPTPFV